MQRCAKKGKREQSFKPRDARESVVAEWPVQQEVVGFGIRRHQRVLDLTALPGLEHWELMEERESGIGNQSSSLDRRSFGFPVRAMIAPSPVGVPSKSTLSR